MIRKIIKQGLGVLATLLLLAACEKVEIPTGEGGGKGDDVPEEETEVEIKGTGEGSLEKPFTVRDILEGEKAQQGRQCWVVGYVVGFTRYSMSNADFTTEGAVQSNVLLADKFEEEDPGLCVPIELNTDKLHKKVSLAYNPDSLGRRIMIEGLVMDYFKVTGLRQVKEFHWLGAMLFPGEEGGNPPPPTEDEEEEPEPEPEKPGATDRDTVSLGADDEQMNGGRVAPRKHKWNRKGGIWR